MTNVITFQHKFAFTGNNLFAKEYGTYIIFLETSSNFCTDQSKLKVIATDNYCSVEINSTGYFLQDVLFPYAKDNVQGFLERNWETVQCKEDVMALKRQVHYIYCFQSG